MKILFLSAGEELMTGVVRYDQEVISGLRNLGHIVQVVTPASVLHSSNLKTTHEKAFFFTQLKNSLSLYSRKNNRVFLEILDEFKPDVVHMSMETSLIFSPFIKLCAQACVPVVGTQHQPIHRERSLMGLILQLSYVLISQFIRSLSRLIVFSETQKKSVIQSGFPADRIVIIPNAVDLTVFTPGFSSFKKEVGADSLVLYLGRFSYQKNPDLVLNTFSSNSFDESIKLVMVGDGEQFPALAQKYSGIANIIFTGAIREKQRVIDILRGADIFVQPSRFEGLSISLLEAMSCGVAPITTAVAAHPDVVKGAGILVDPANVEKEFGQALVSLIENPPLREELGKKARERVLERYSLEGMLHKLVELYQSILQS